MALLTPAQTAAEIKRKAAAGIPLTNTSNAANNAAYKAATAAKPSTGGVTIPNMSLVNTTPAPNSGVTVPNYTAPSSTPLNPTPAVTMPSANPTVKPVTIPRTEQTLNTQTGLVNTPWKYNAAEDQSLQSAIRDADNKLLVNQKNTNAFLRSNGQGKSSYSETVANQLANQSAENIANTLVPQYEALAYQKNQDQIGNLRNLYSDQYQQDVTRPLSEADRTGVYQDAQTRDDLFQIMMYKAEAEAPGTTPERRAELNALANQRRASLDSRGVDSSQVGANVNSKNINTSGIGIRTIQGQQLDLNADNQKFNQKLSTRQQDFTEGTTNAQLTGYMPDGTRTTAEQQRQLTNLWTVAEQLGTIPNELADLYGIARGTQTQSAKQLAAQITNDIRGLDISQQNADTSRYSAENNVALSQDDNARQWAALDYEQSNPAASKYTGMTASQLLDNIKPLYQEPIYTVDKLGNQVDTGKTQLTKNPAKLTELFETVVDAGLSDTETKQVLLSLGFTMKDIESRIKQYSGN